jgi:hypothetical protein
MDTGFGQNLEGFLIKGNLSLVPSQLPSLHGDGSIEGSGTLYIDTIREYNVDNGIDLQNVTFKNKIVSVPYTAPSINATSASFLLSGGLSINNSVNATSATSGGALTIAGGASIQKNLEMGGIINMNNNSIINVPLPINGGDAVNKDYVDFVSTKISGDFNKYEVIFGDSDSGDLIKGSSLFTFDETKLNLNAPFIISTSTNATDINSSIGALIVDGGAIIRQQLQLGDDLNMNMNYISNVSDPINSQDVATKKYVDDRKLQGSFTTGQVIIAASIGDEIRGYPSFTYNGTQLSIFSSDNISESSGGTFINYGGSVFLNDIYIDGKITLNDKIITGVAEPTELSDVATKNYVDSKTYGNLLGSIGANQLVVGTTTEGQLQSYPSFTFDGNLLLLNTSASFYIINTENASGLGSGGSFTVDGGGSFGKDLYIGGKIILNNDIITGVSLPINGNDVATKDYVDSKTYGNLLGTIGENQVVIGANTQGELQSFPSFTYNGTTLELSTAGSFYIRNTTNADGLASGGALTVLGGASFSKDVYIGGELDVNLKNIKSVADPIEAYDAVNKAYVDDLVGSISLNVGGNTFTLNQNVTIAEDIPNFYYTSTVKAFIATVFVKYNNLKSATFTLYGINCGERWILNSSFIGEQTGVHFHIRRAGNQGIMQYTNENVSGITSIKFRTISRVDDLSSSAQYNYTLLNSSTPLLLDIPELTYLNSEVDSVKITLYLSSETSHDCALFLLNCVQRNGLWSLTPYCIDNGNNASSDIKFSIVSSGSDAKIYYLNNNVETDYTVRIKQSIVLKTQNTVTLNANVSTPIPINTIDLSYPLTDNSFQLTLYVFNLLDDKYALYEIQGVVSNSQWMINSRFIGDNLGIKFYIQNIGDIGKLTYTNSSENDAYIRYSKLAPITFEPLPVNKGGTGTDFLLPYGVLRGDGTNPILASEDFIYKNKELILGDESSIILKNTQTATSLTDGGTLTSYGGASFAKDVFIGGELDVNLKNIRNVADPVLDFDAVNKKYIDAEIDRIDLTSSVNDDRIENTFTLDNNVLSAHDIPGFKFSSDTVKAFISNIYIEIDGNECALYTIHGINCDSHWSISTIFTGQQTSISFNIREQDGYGIMQYTNQNEQGTSYIRYRTMTEVNDVGLENQLNLTLNANQTVPTRINELEFLNSEIDSVKLIIYVSSATDNKYGLYLSNCVLKGNEWVMHTHATGNVQGVHFSIENESSPIPKGIINYRNMNSANDYTIRVKQIKIETSQEEFILDPNISDPTIIDDEKLAFLNTDTYFQMSVFVNVPALNKYALFEIRGVVCEGIWNINTRYIGDYTGVRFYIYSSPGGIGYLTYTNSNSTLANIRFIKNAPIASLKPLQINKGGTGSSFLVPNAVLRGNGVDPIIGTSDFIYDNNKLVLGNLSSIILKSTSAAISLTAGGTLTSYGGMSVNKELLVGEKLIVKNKDITPNIDDICVEQSFDANNNQITAAPVVGFIFASVTTKAFTSMATITLNTISEIYDSLFEIKGLKKSSGWVIYTNSVGDDTGVAFSIDTTTGQIYYTSSHHPDWISTKIKFRAITTTV